MPRWLEIPILLSVLILAAALHGQWLSHDNAIMEIDAVDHIQAFQKYRFVHGNPDIPLSERLHGLFSYQYYTSIPPLIIWMTWPVVEIFGSSLNVVRSIAVVCLLIYLLGIYLLAHRLGGPWAAVSAACLALWFADVTLLGHVYGTFLLAPGCVALAVWALLGSQGYSNPWRCIAAGLLLLGALWSERGTPPIYLAAPLGLITLAAIKDIRKQERSISWVGVGIVLAVVLPILAALPWILGYLKINAEHNSSLAGTALYPYRDLWYYYLKKGPRIIFGYSNALLFVFAIVLTLAKKVSGRWLLLLWIAVPFIFFSSIATKDFIYLAGITPPAAVLMGLAVANLKNDKRRLAILIPFVLLGAMQSVPRLLPWPWLTRFADNHPIILQWQRPTAGATLPQYVKPLRDELNRQFSQNSVAEDAAFLIAYTGRRYPANGAHPENEGKRLQIHATFLRPWSVTSVLYVRQSGIVLFDALYNKDVLDIAFTNNSSCVNRLDALSHDFDALHLIIGRTGQGAFRGFHRAKERRQGGNIIFKNVDSFSHPPYAIDPAMLKLDPQGSISTTGDLKIRLWMDESHTH